MYPGVHDFENFQVTVNRSDGFCPGNAWYSPGDPSINFCLPGGGHPNTAWTSVVYHEYGHHLVAAGGSGQGQYGEGMGDVMSNIILDTHLLGLGFFGDCDVPLRDPVANFRTYPCGGGIHDCGQLLSGCFWDLREELVITEPDDYQMILLDLAVNSILEHTGSGITPDITIDVLTLDDDDGDIFNGTPHYAEIDAAFTPHNMDPPPLSLFSFNYPDDRPEVINPDGGTTFTVEITPLLKNPAPGTATLHLDSGSGFDAIALDEISENLYEVVIPASECGSIVSYFFSAESDGGAEQVHPVDAPDGSFSALSAYGPGQITFEDDFETDQDWSVQDSPGLTAGTWERGTPVGGGDRGDPPTDADGSGQGYLTENQDGDSDVDDGTTILTSPVMDASGDKVLLSYYRWYDNTFGNAPESDIFEVDISDDGGASWQSLEVVGPSGPEVAGGWFYKEFNLDEIPGFELNDQFRVRFVASDLGAGSVVEAGVDGVKLQEIDCEQSCVGDIDGGDGEVNTADLLTLLAGWGTNGPGADIAEPLDVVDTADLLGLLSAWGQCE